MCPAPGKLIVVSDFFDLRDAHDDTISEAINQAVDVIRDGELVVLPTDTLYGLGADAFDHDAVAKLLATKGRGRNMPPPVLLPHARTVDGVADQIDDTARKLMAQFWPGPLTVILYAHPTLKWDLGDSEGTVAVRVPRDDVTLELLNQTGPLAVSSANRSGAPAATTAAAAQEAFGDDVAVYLETGSAASTIGSTIVDCTRTPCHILRTGVLSVDQIRAVAPDAIAPEDAESKPSAKAAASIELDRDVEPPVSITSAELITITPDPEPASPASDAAGQSPVAPAPQETNPTSGPTDRKPDN